MSTKKSPSDENDPKNAWKVEAARTADENCRRFYDYVDMLQAVPELVSPIKPETGTAQARQLLLTLFGPGATACAALSADKFALVNVGTFSLRKPAAPDGAFFKVNSMTGPPTGRKGGVTDADVGTEYLMLEMDRASKSQQALFWRTAIAAGFPVISLTDSGGKSLHAILRIAAASKEDFKTLAQEILDLLEPFIPDGTSRNPSRYTRLPGVLRGEGEDQRPQELLYLNPAALTWSEHSEICDVLHMFRGQALPVPAKVKSALTRARERIDRLPGESNDAENKDFRKRLDKVLKGRVVDLEKYVQEAGWHLFSSEPVKGLEDKHFITCPWSDEHTGGGDDDTQTDAYIFQRTTTARFKWGFHCSHHVCQERQTVDLIELAAAEAPELFEECLLPDNDVMASFEAISDTPPPAKPVAVPESLLLAQPCDVDNVTIFHLLYKDQVRFFHDENEWAVWDGSRWRRDDKGAVNRLAASVRALRESAAGKDIDAAARAKSAGSAKSIGNLITLAKSMLPIATVASEFDRHAHLLGCPNGTLDLRTGTLRPSRPEDHITLQTGVKFNPTATCPRHMLFLGEIHPDNPDISLFLQRWFGYCLCGSTRLDKMLVFHGARGRNGKSTLVRIMTHVLGDYARTMASGFLAANHRPGDSNAPSPSLMGLKNRRLAFTSETNEGLSLDEAKVKMLTGGDNVTGRDVFGRKEITFRPEAKIVLSSNHRPEVKGTDPAIWARILLVEFKESFLDREDLNLEADLEKEAEGILAWAVRGYQEFLRIGLAVPPEIANATIEYRAEEDRLQAFLDECTAPDPSKTSRVGRSGLYQVYAAWAERNHVRPMWSAKIFSRKMRERGFSEIKHYGEWQWLGFRCEAVSD